MKFGISSAEEYWGVFVYERLPKFCHNCGRLGHINLDCTWSSIQEYNPRQISYRAWMFPDPKQKPFKIIWHSDSKYHLVDSNSCPRDSMSKWLQ